MKNVRLRSPDSLGSSELNNLGEKFPVNNHNIWQQLVSTLLSVHPVTLEHVSLGFCQVRYLEWPGQPGPIPCVSSESSAQPRHCHIVKEEVFRKWRNKDSLVEAPAISKSLVKRRNLSI